MATVSWRDETKHCLNCNELFGTVSYGGKPIDKTRWGRKHFCSKSCAALRQNRLRHSDPQGRFEGKIMKAGADDCWLWAGRKSQEGYGYFEIRTKQFKAHRVAYTLAKGPIPEGMLIRHTCDNPPCVNPNHLLVGTDADNVRDMMKRGRHASAAKYPSDRIFKILKEYNTLPKGPKGRCSPGISAAFLKKYDLPSQTLSNWLHDFSVSF